MTAVNDSGTHASVIFNLMSSWGKKKDLYVHRLKIHPVFYQVVFTLFKGGHVEPCIR
jgi:hypothetical protein